MKIKIKNKLEDIQKFNLRVKLTKEKGNKKMRDKLEKIKHHKLWLNDEIKN